MAGRKARMLRQREQGNDGGIRHWRPQFEIRKSSVPAGDSGIVLGYRFQRVHAGRAGSIAVQVILEDLQVYRIEPGGQKGGLPKPRRVIPYT